MAMQRSIVVIGGAGFIGSHVVVELLEQGYNAVVLDRMDEAKKECLRRIQQITGKTVQYFNADINDESSLKEVFNKIPVSCVIHLAAKKYHGQSNRNPLEYYRNNIGGFMNILKVMKESGVQRLIYASTVAVYGTMPKSLPLKEELNVGENLRDTYSRTKYFCEEILKDLCLAEKDWSVMILRFFNPVGAHKSGLIGEQMIADPPNMMPNLVKTAMGKRDTFVIYGGKFDTKDGTGERDYTHVVDIAKGHVAAMKKTEVEFGLKVYNLGLGRPCSSLDMLKTLENVIGKQIPYTLIDPRPFDAPSSWADVSMAHSELGWTAQLSLMDICSDAWRWYSNNPNGYMKETAEK